MDSQQGPGNCSDPCPLGRADVEGSFGSSNVTVMCRFRPESTNEKVRGGKPSSDFLAGGRSLRLLNTDIDEDFGHSFTFDRVFVPTTPQEEIDKHVGEDVAEAVLQGYNGTILAYGQTSSGKTYTMEGVEGNQGLIPRIVGRIVDKIKSNRDDKVRFSLTVSMFEIYRERIRDLIDVSRVNLPIREDPEKGIWVEGVLKTPLQNKDEIMEIMKVGQANRATAATKMNDYSSRSHSIFMVDIIQDNLKTLSKKSGKLFLVDLAGSEKVEKTGAKGTRLEEAKTINKSLSALGNVISALTDKTKKGIAPLKHIPYRDSKLTRVLQESLGGNSKTALIICCSPSSYNYDETLSTLRFGQRMKLMKNKAVVNEDFSYSELKELLAKANNEISRLKENILSSSQEPSMKQAENKFTDHEHSYSSTNKIQRGCTPENCVYYTSYAREKDSRTNAELMLQNVSSKLDLVMEEQGAKQKSIELTLKKSEKIHQKRLDGSKTQIIQLEERLSTSKQEIAQKNELLRESKNMIAQLNQNKISRNEFETLKNENEEFRKKLVLAQNALKISESNQMSLTELIREAENNISLLRNSLQVRESELEKYKNGRNDRLQEAKSRVQSLEHNLSEVRAENVILTKQLTHAYSENEKIKTSVDRLQADLENSATEIKNAHSAAENSTEELNLASSQLKDLKNENLKLINRNKEVENHLLEVQSKHQEQIKMKKVEEENLLTTIEQLKNDNLKLENIREAEKEKIAIFELEIVRLKSKLTSLQSESGKIENIQKSLATAESANLQLMGNLKLTKEAFEKELKEKQELEESKCRLQQELVNANISVSSLNEEVMRLKSFEEQLREVKKAYKTKTSESENLASSMAKLSEEVKELNIQCGNKTTENQNLASSIASLNQDKEESKRKIESLKLKLTSLTSDLVEKESEIKLIKQESEKQELSRQVDKESFEIASVKVLGLETKLKESENKVNYFKERIKSLERQLDNSKDLSKSEQERYEEAVKYSASLKDELHNALQKVKNSTDALKVIENKQAENLSELENLKTENSNLDDKLKVADKLNVTYKEENRVSAEKLLKKQKEHANELQTLRDELLKIKAIQKSEAKQSNEKIRNLENSLDISKEEITKVNSSLEKYKTANHALKSDIEHSESCFEEERKLEKLKIESVTATSEKEIQRLKSFLSEQQMLVVEQQNAHSSILEEKEQRIISLSSSLNTAKEELLLLETKLENKTEGYHKQALEIDKTLQEQMSLRTSLEKECERLRQDIKTNAEQTAAENEKVKNLITDLEQRLAVELEMKQKAEVEVEKCQHENQNTSTELSQHKIQLEEKDAEIVNLQEQISSNKSVAAMNRKLVNNLSEMKEELKMVKTDNEKYQQQTATLETKIKQLKDLHVSEINSLTKKLNEKDSRLIQTNQNYEAQVEILKREKEDFQSREAEHIQKINQLEEQIHSLKKGDEVNERTITNLKKQVQDETVNQKTMSSLKNDLEKSQKLYQDNIASLSKELNELKQGFLQDFDTRTLFEEWENQKNDILESKSVDIDKEQTGELIAAQIRRDREKVMKSVKMVLFEAEIVHKQTVGSIVRSGSNISTTKSSPSTFNKLISKDVAVLQDKLARRDHRIKMLENALLDAKYATIKSQGRQEKHLIKKTSMKQQLSRRPSFSRAMKGKIPHSPTRRNSGSRIQLAERVRSVLKLQKHQEVIPKPVLDTNE